MQWFLTIGSVTTTSLMPFHLRKTNPKSFPAKYKRRYLIKQYFESRNTEFIEKKIT